MVMGPRKGDKPYGKPTGKPTPKSTTPRSIAETPVEPKINAKAFESFGKALRPYERRMARSDWEAFSNWLIEGGGRGDNSKDQYRQLRDSFAQGAIIAGKAKTREEALKVAAREMRGYKKPGSNKK